MTRVPKKYRPLPPFAQGGFFLQILAEMTTLAKTGLIFNLRLRPQERKDPAYGIPA
jgi:hypothetical protein